MDIFDANYNELYKLHTGHTLHYDSDNDSSGSNASSSYFEKYKPPLYTYEELQANLIVTEPVSVQSTTELNVAGANKAFKIDSWSQQIIKEELEKLVLTDSCILCNVKKCSKHDIENHKKGKSHVTKVDQYINDRLNILRSKNTYDAADRRDGLQTSSASSLSIPSRSPTDFAVALATPICKKSLEEIQQEKLLLPDYCFVCNADLWQPNNANAHYNSRRHKNNIEEWKYNNGSMQLAQKSVEEIQKEKLEKLLLLDYCFVCNVYIPDPNDAFSHYNSKRHNSNIEEWKCNNGSLQVVKKSLEEIQQEKLEKLLLPDYCLVCNADIREPNNAFSHYNSRRHENNIEVWKCNNGSLQVAEKSLEEIQQEKLEKLLLPDYCLVCNADIRAPNNAFSHYNSKRHENNIEEWKRHNGSLQDRNVQTYEEILEEKLAGLICSDYCSICLAYLPGEEQFKSHYNSKRHKDNLSTWTNEEMQKLKYAETSSVPKNIKQIQQVDVQNQLEKIDVKVSEPAASVQSFVNFGSKHGVQNVELNVNPLCKVCGTNVETELLEHYKSDWHTRNIRLFCFICNLKTTSNKQLEEHVRGIEHRSNLEQGKDSEGLTIRRTIIVTPAIKKDEEINKESLSESNQYNSEVKKDEKLQITSQAIQKVLPLRWCYCDACKIPLDGTEKAESHYKDASHILRNITFYCHICKLTYGSKSEMDLHLKNFPHNKISQLMSLVVSKGISTRNFFWKFSQWEIRCTLCEACIQSESSATSHLESKKHLKNFNTWCCSQPRDTKDSNRRWYYCDLCNLPLDGTTNVELHYQGKSHAKKQKESTQRLQTSAVDRISKTDTSLCGANTDTIKDNKLNPLEENTNKDEARYLQEIFESKADNKKSNPLNEIKNKEVIYLQELIPLRTIVTELNHLKEFENEDRKGNYLPEKIGPEEDNKKLETIKNQKKVKCLREIIQPETDTNKLTPLKENKDEETNIQEIIEPEIDKNELNPLKQIKNKHKRAKYELILVEADDNNKLKFLKAIKNIENEADCIEEFIGLAKDNNEVNEFEEIRDKNEEGKYLQEMIRLEKCDNELNQLDEIKNKDAKQLQEMIYSETKKLVIMLQTIPPSKALNCLQRYNKELKNLSKRNKAHTVNVEYTILSEDVFEKVDKTNMIQTHRIDTGQIPPDTAKPNNFERFITFCIDNFLTICHKTGIITPSGDRFLDLRAFALTLLLFGYRITRT